MLERFKAYLQGQQAHIEKSMRGIWRAKNKDKEEPEDFEAVRSELNEMEKRSELLDCKMIGDLHLYSVTANPKYRQLMEYETILEPQIKIQTDE